MLVHSTLGLDETVIRKISESRNEPAWLLDFRLKAYGNLLKMKQPTWSELEFDEIDLSKIVFYQKEKKLDSQELLELKESLGLQSSDNSSVEHLNDNVQKNKTSFALDLIVDSNSIETTFQHELAKKGILFCSMRDAVKLYPKIVREYLGSVIPPTDNYYACLNSCVFGDGSFCYIPSGVICPMELSTYFRIESLNSGQFERTLIIAMDNSSVSYLEGCTAPSNNINQLHSAVVEIIAGENASVKYSTVQNWYSGDENGIGGIFNFVTKRGLCRGNNSSISWTQVEVGSSITWKYPSVILKGDNSRGQFYSLAITKNSQQADTGTKMIHIGKGTKSQIFSKSICLDNSLNVYRGLVRIASNADNCTNYSQCDTIFINKKDKIQQKKLQEILEKLEKLL